MLMVSQHTIGLKDLSTGKITTILLATGGCPDKTCFADLLKASFGCEKRALVPRYVIAIRDSSYKLSIR
jgi:hypothetical protein